MTLLEAENYKADWYGWMVNQTAHAGWGAITYILFCTGWFFTFGEFPYKIAAWLIITMGYIFWEFVIQRGRLFWDSVEDLVFWSGYGAGILALTIDEVTPGSSEFTGKLSEFSFLLSFFIFHQLCGITIRKWQASK